MVKEYNKHQMLLYYNAQ